MRSTADTNISIKECSNTNGRSTTATSAAISTSSADTPLDVHVSALKCSAQCRGEQQWYTLYRLLDADNDGLVPLHELREAVRNSADVLELQNDEATTLLADVDKNADHFVDFAEFSALVSLD